MTVTTDVFLFNFDDYKAYLNAYIASQPKRGYGFRSRVAQAAGCKTAYVAQVLGGGAHFSLEQAEGINGLLEHSEDEGDFFLLLVQFARAGTERLRRRLRAQMKTLRDRQTNLKQRFGVRSELSEQEVLEFFSRWSIVAVHIAATIPRLKTRAAIAEALAVEPSLVKDALDFLIAKGLLEEKNGRLEPGPTKLFVGKDSAILKMHHANWRQKAIQYLDRDKADENVHFTAVYSVSAVDAPASASGSFEKSRRSAKSWALPPRKSSTLSLWTSSASTDRVPSS